MYLSLVYLPLQITPKISLILWFSSTLHVDSWKKLFLNMSIGQLITAQPQIVVCLLIDAISLPVINNIVIVNYRQ